MRRRGYASFAPQCPRIIVVPRPGIRPRKAVKSRENFAEYSCQQSGIAGSEMQLCPPLGGALAALCSLNWNETIAIAAPAQLVAGTFGEKLQPLVEALLVQ